MKLLLRRLTPNLQIERDVIGKDSDLLDVLHCHALLKIAN